MPFVKGKSGNPSGQKKAPQRTIRRVSALAREHTDTAIKTLVEIMKSKSAPPTARATSAQALLDRGWGRPAQTVNANVNPIDKLNESDQVALLAALDALSGGEGDDQIGAEETTH